MVDVDESPAPRIYTNNMKQATLCFLIDKENKRIVLGKKKRGFAKNKYNGLGGKVSPKETVEEAALRELSEEAGVISTEESLQKVGVFNFHFPTKQDWGQTVHVFIIQKWQNEPKETEEMLPQWFDFDQIPFGEMWEDEYLWLPLVLKGKKFKADFYFKEDNETIKEYTMMEVTSFK